MPDFVYTKVDPNRLGVAAVNIENTLNVLESAFNTVDDVIRNTLRPIWSDIASDQFYKQYAYDKLIFSAQMKTLQALNKQLKEASGIYDKADDKAGELVGMLRIG